MISGDLDFDRRNRRRFSVRD